MGEVELGLQWELRIQPAPTPLQHGQVAVLLIDGTVTCQQANGGLGQQRLKSHDMRLDAKPSKRRFLTPHQVL